MNIIYGDIMEKWCKENDFSITELINGAYEWAEECGAYGVRDFEYKTGRGDGTTSYCMLFKYGLEEEDYHCKRLKICKQSEVEE